MRSMAAGSLRRLLLLNTAYNIRTFQAPLSCSACRQVRHFCSSDHGGQNKITRYTLIKPAVTQYAARFQSTLQGSESSVDAVETKQEKPGMFLNGIIRILKVIAAPMVKKSMLVGSAKNMYNCCVAGIDFDELADACDLPDTMQSWFAILHLHIWMCLVRLKPEGKDGNYMLKKLVQMMWLDVEERIKNLGTFDSVVTRDSLQALLRQFYGLTIAYDEGLLCDDTVLATVLWRNLFHNKERTDAEQLARLVEYVRKNVQHLDNLSSEQILSNGTITWLPFYEQTEVQTESGEDTKEL